MAARTDAVLDRIRPLHGEGDVAVVAHGHLARVLTVRRLGLDASAARLLGHPHPALSVSRPSSTGSRSSTPGTSRSGGPSSYPP
ncbi:histidine phosphatase family protein [Kitasatospora sp. NPDC050463]|uniref:histidine phosphatase family protein n=1 Tax=Kitasatospora sp. NPDC050463 TaxID=3155786 RepID=UPI0033FBA1D5